MTSWIESARPINKLSVRGITATSELPAPKNGPVSRQYLEKLTQRLESLTLTHLNSPSAKQKCQTCPFCKKRKKGLLQHIKDVHPDRLEEYTK